MNKPDYNDSELEQLKVAKKKVINSFERIYLIQLRTENKGDVVSSAKRAGKSRTALWNLLKKYIISPKQIRH
jgi:DNA-binding NtrC family response regulator